MKEADDGDGTLTYEVYDVFDDGGDDGDDGDGGDAFEGYGDYDFRNQNISIPFPYSLTLSVIEEFNEMVRKAQTIMGGE